MDDEQVIIVVEESPDVQPKEEHIEFVEVVELDEVTIPTENAFPPLGAPVAEKNHANLNGRELADQHPINSITGLRDELDNIESLKTVCSDNRQHANYYAWLDQNPSSENREGFFVSIFPSTDKIKKCNGTNDVFGVTVSAAGFIGGQGYALSEDGENKVATPMGADYALVVCSGTVDVLCESGIDISFDGDPVYVVPNKDGVAKISNGNYGYLATALIDRDGVNYVTISLTASSTKEKDIADKVQDLGNRMTSSESNIVSITNNLQTTRQLVNEIKDSLDTNVKELDGRLDSTTNKTDKNETDIETTNGKVTELDRAVEEAKVTLNTTVNTVNTECNKAVTRANDAIAASKEVMDDLKEYQKIVANIDKYTVGAYSQASGLTLNQSIIVLDNGMVYVPTVTHTEEYAFTDDQGDDQVVEQQFDRGYYYVWNYSVESDTNNYWFVSAKQSVQFIQDGSEPLQGNVTNKYLVIENENITIDDGTTYDMDTLYEWLQTGEDIAGKWVAVAKVNQNATNRTVALIKHTENEISQEITDTRGDVASLSARLDEDGARVAMTARVVTSMNNIKPADTVGTYEELPTSGVTDGDYYCVGTSAPYDVYQYVTDEFVKQNNLYYDGSYFCEVNAASIVTAVNNNGDSSITLNADKINFSGLSTFFDTDDNGKITAINGGGITTGSITADQIAANTITANELSTDAITSNGYKVNITGSKLNLSDGSFDSKYLKWDSEGKITAKSGTIGSGTSVWNIGASGIYNGKTSISDNTTEGAYIGTDGISIGGKTNYFKATSSGELIATNANITGGTIGGWTITKNLLYGLTSDKETGTGMQNPSSGVWSFAAGFTDFSSWKTAPFRVSHTGELHAENAYIEGEINATSGTFSNCTINADCSIYGGLVGNKLSTYNVTTQGTRGSIEWIENKVNNYAGYTITTYGVDANANKTGKYSTIYLDSRGIELYVQKDIDTQKSLTIYHDHNGIDVDISGTNSQIQLSDKNIFLRAPQLLYSYNNTSGVFIDYDNTGSKFIGSLHGVWTVDGINGTDDPLDGYYTSKGTIEDRIIKGAGLGTLLWNGAYVSEGDTIAFNTGDFSLFRILMAQEVDGTYQNCYEHIIASKEVNYIRGVGGFIHQTNNDLFIHGINLTNSSTGWTLTKARSFQIPDGLWTEHNVTTLYVRAIYGIL